MDPDRDDQDFLFRRHPANPLITVADLPYRANAVFNPGAARVGDETCSSSVSRTCGGSPTSWSRAAATAPRDWRFDDRPLL